MVYLIQNSMFLYVETREMKEKIIADLASLVKSQEGELI